jgi:hypothetical protein
MGDLVPIFIGVFLIAFILSVPIMLIERDKQRIRMILQRKGAKKIGIAYLPPILDRSNNLYDVEYEDSDGRLHVGSCKVSLWSGRIYWKDEE